MGKVLVFLLNMQWHAMGIVFKIKLLSFRQNNLTCVFYNAKIKNALAT